MTKRTTIIPALLLIAALPATAQERNSSSQYLQPSQKADVTITYSIDGEGKRYQPTWGLDLQWINEQNLRKGINHIGLKNIGIGRSGFRATVALENDTLLGSDQINYLRQRSNLFNIVSPTLPLVLTADQEAGAVSYYVTNKSCNVPHWAAMINSHVDWMQKNTRHPIIGVSPYNEPDYWTTEEGATTTKQQQVAKTLKEQWPSRYDTIAIVGGNTLNNDKALSWYTTGQQYYDWGNTHQLAGSFDTFAAFFQRLKSDGKVGYADEMHNVGEAMIGLEYGMTVGIWWGFDSRARGEFCDISRNGERLAYGEHRNNWTAASVYRHDDGRVKAFVGSSERQAYTTTYQFLSPDREVYYDGHGPLRDFTMEIPGGTGYQQGQTNAERVIDIIWGEDVPPMAITTGKYKIINKATGTALAYDGSSVLIQRYSGNKKQQWNISPADPRKTNGDYSFYDIESVNKSNLHLNVRDFSTVDGAEVIAYSVNTTPSSNEQWYFEYAGDGFYYIRNRETATLLTAKSSNIVVNSLQTGSNANRQLWKILPISATYDTAAPAQPTGLTATPQPASVLLSWTANTEADIDGYNILRMGADAEWNTIARKVKGTTFTDNACRPGTHYIYKVVATDQAQNRSEASETAEATPTGEPSMVARWHFDGSTVDVTENMMDAAIYGTATYSDDHASGSQSISLDGKSSYIQLPYEVVNSEEMTIMMWVYWRGGNAWQRVFDFGNGTSSYMFLTPHNGSRLSFAIKNGGDEQTLNGTTKLAQNKWKHLCITLAKDKATLYLDGQSVNTTTGITISPADLHPALNYLGRSQFQTDPMFNGSLDDVRIYNYALTAEEIQAAMADTANGIVAPTVQAGSPSLNTYDIGGRPQPIPRKGIVIKGGKTIIQ